MRRVVALREKNSSFQVANPSAHRARTIPIGVLGFTPVTTLAVGAESIVQISGKV
jgi:hypothetical protein